MLSFRALFFFATFLFMSLWQFIRPCRSSSASLLEKFTRWFSNIFLGILNSTLIYFSVLFTLVEVAFFTEKKGWGLYRVFDLDISVEIFTFVLILDLVIYVQHLTFHKVPWLWQIHKVHHSDFVLDTSTGVRFHPLEIIFSLFLKSFVICFLGVSPLSVIVFEVILSSMTLFNHSNIHLPDSVDFLLRKVLVTPNMHELHHSKIPSETNSNYGFNLSLWDFLFKTHKNRKGFVDIGLNACSSKEGFWGLLIMPFKK